MPLRSLFSRNKKNQSDNAPNPSSSNSNSIYSNIAASSSKLRLAFLSKPSSSSFSHDSLITAPPGPPQISRGSSSSDASIPDRRHPRPRPGPPPSKSALFAAYADHNAALSTRSLPQRPSFPNFSSFSESLPASEPISPAPQPPPTQPEKPLKSSSRGFFPWTRARTKSKENDKDTQKQSAVRSGSTPDYLASSHPHTSPYTLSLPEANTGSSFNLKSFRHIRAPSPPLLPPLTPVATERLRSGSNASEASQRISVAAFREAYARRSGTGSPIPSTGDHEPPSARVATATADDGNYATPSKSTPNLRARGAGPRQSGARRLTAPPESSRRSGTTTSEYRVSGSAYVDSSESESEEDSEEDQEEDQEEDTSVVSVSVSVRRGSTDKGKGKAMEREERVVFKTRTKASSEVGHSYNSYARATPAIVSTPMRPSASGTSAARVMSAYELEPERTLAQVTPRSQSSLGVYGGAMRARASVSASALVPSGGAKASSSRPSTGSTSSQSSSRRSSHSSDDDDAPLASLVNPRSPGSAMSHGSGSGSPRKPLIDIRSLKMPSLPPSRGIRPSVPGEEGRPVRFLSPVNSLVSARTRKDKNPGGDKDREKNRVTSDKDKDKSQDAGVRLSGSNLSERLAKIVQQGAGAAGPKSAVVAAGKPLDAGADIGVNTGSDSTVTVRGHRRASSDDYARGARLEVDGKVGWLLVEDKDVELENDKEREREKSQGIDMETDTDKEKDKESEGRIVPTPIRQRVPPSSFSVTSRPQNPGAGTGASATSPTASSASGMSQPSSPITTQTRQRSTTMVTPSPSNATGAGAGTGAAGGVLMQPRQRSSSLIPYSVAPAPAPTPTSTLTKPFAGRRWESPASSTGDSSSGRAPLTPGDGSDLGVGVRAPRKGGDRDRDRDKDRDKERNRDRDRDRDRDKKRGTEWSTGVSGLGVGRSKVRGAIGQTKKQSVNFGDDMARDRERERRDDDNDSHGEGEMRRRERRRSEAKAAIELGNVINGPGPIVDDDDEDGDGDDDSVNGMSGRMSMMNPMMGMSMGMGGQMPMTMPMSFGAAGGASGWNTWQQQQQQQQQQQVAISAMPMQMQMQMQAQAPMLSPAQFMIPPPTDPNLFAAHQQAMMFAKQAYQMAVAQQALAAAGEEWERGSSGGAGSVFGGMGMGMGGMGMGWGAPQMYAGAGTRSVYGGISGAQSEYGGGRASAGAGAGGWNSSKSVYGEAFGPPGDRDRDRNRARMQKSAGMQQGRESGHHNGGQPSVPPLPQGGVASGNTNANANANGGNGGANTVGKGVRARTTSVPGKMRKPIPPSSWRAGPTSAAATGGG